MKAKVKIVEEANTLSLSVTKFDVNSGALLQARLNELLPILREIIYFDECLLSLPADVFEQRRDASAAMDLKFQGLLLAAQEQAISAHEVVTGISTASEHGFPEFDNE